MSESCGYTNSHGVSCGRPPHPESPADHQLYEQLVMPDPFCLQPWDRLSLATIRAWIVSAVAHGVPAAKVQKAEEHFNEIKRWQRRHGTRLPD